MRNGDDHPSRETVKAVITTHNRKRWAQEAIESALAQTYSPIHIVVVDDASSDGTAALADEYARKYPDRVTALTKTENQGVADSVRRGLEAGPEAEYVALLNDDDLWYPTFVERSVALLRERPTVGLVYSECDVVDEERAPTGQLFSDRLGRFGSGDFMDTLGGNHASASTLVLTRGIAERAAKTLPDRLVVFDYYIVMLAAGYSSIARIDEPLAIYRETTGGLHTNTARAWRDTTLARLYLFERHPALVAICGGRRDARREVSLRTLDVAMYQWASGRRREYLWHAARILRLGQLRACHWMADDPYGGRDRPRQVARHRPSSWTTIGSCGFVMASHEPAAVKVVITTYRRPSWLREAVDSALDQAGVTVHVVIVDDDSGDKSSEVIADFIARYPTQVTAILKARNRGIADSIRLGLEAGPAASYVALLNDDDRWLPDKLRLQLETLSGDRELTACFTEAYVIDADGDRTGALYSERLGPFVSCEFGQIFRADPVCASTLAMRSDIARRVASTMPDDAVAYDFYVALVCAGVGTLARSAEPLAEYRVSPTNAHLRANALARSTTKVRVAAMADYPELRQRAGGRRAARRQISLATLEEALMRLEVREWREFLWHSCVVVRQRQLRPGRLAGNSHCQHTSWTGTDEGYLGGPEVAPCPS